MTVTTRKRHTLQYDNFKVVYRVYTMGYLPGYLPTRAQDQNNSDIPGYHSEYDQHNSEIPGYPSEYDQNSGIPGCITYPMMTTTLGYPGNYLLEYVNQAWYLGTPPQTIYVLNTPLMGFARSIDAPRPAHPGRNRVMWSCERNS